LAEQLIDAQKQATDAATEIKSTKLKIEHLEKEIQTKSKHLQVRYPLLLLLTLWLKSPRFLLLTSVTHYSIWEATQRSLRRSARLPSASARSCAQL